MDASIKSITEQKIGHKLTLKGLVDRIAQTSGPTLFALVDGTGLLMLKGFDGPGVRAFPDVNEGDAVQVMVEIREFQGKIEGEILKMAKLQGAAATKAREDIDNQVRERAKVKPIPFMVQSPILEKLKDRFVKAASEIKFAIITNRPVIVRHHNDADGYSSGYALERAIIPLIEEQHGPGKAAWEYYTRSPVAAPMYEIEDSIKDTAHSLSDVAKFSNKMPLVVIVDTGSGEEDLLGIQQGKIHGIDFIVVDHHVFDKDVISSEVLVHINPFLVKEDGALYSAGMLCAELARFINPNVKSDYLPALAGLADRINNPPVMDKYLEIASKQGYTKELLHDLAALIDFVSAKLRFMEAREYIEVVFGDPIDRQKKLVQLMSPYIRKLEAKGLAVAKAAAIKEHYKKTDLVLLYVEKCFPRGAYPKPGKCVGMLHDEIQKTDKTDKLVSVGVLADLITMRATEASGFSVHEFMDYLNKKVPLAFIEGGGHHRAGAIKFVPDKQEDILKALREFLKK